MARTKTLWNLDDHDPDATPSPDPDHDDAPLADPAAAPVRRRVHDLTPREEAPAALPSRQRTCRLYDAPIAPSPVPATLHAPVAPVPPAPVVTSTPTPAAPAEAAPRRSPAPPRPVVAARPATRSRPRPLFDADPFAPRPTPIPVPPSPPVTPSAAAPTIAVAADVLAEKVSTPQPVAPVDRDEPVAVPTIPVFTRARLVLGALALLALLALAVARVATPARCAPSVPPAPAPRRAPPVPPAPAPRRAPPAPSEPAPRHLSPAVVPVAAPAPTVRVTRPGLSPAVARLQAIAARCVAAERERAPGLHATAGFEYHPVVGGGVVGASPRATVTRGDPALAHEIERCMADALATAPIVAPTPRTVSVRR